VSQSGITRGLTVILDGHTDQLAGNSIETGIKGFNGLISYRGSFPMVSQRGFQIRPGHNNLVSISATMILADEDLGSLSPKKRNCRFSNEIADLNFHKEYTQSNCLFECSLNYAQSELTNVYNRTCSPWFFPTYKSAPQVCDPWDTIDFLKETFETPDSKCTCLPGCNKIIYHTSITAVPFRRCDDSNLGTSKLCDLEDTTMPEPKMWGQQVKDEYVGNQAGYISDIKSNERQYLASIGGSGVFKNLEPKKYNAYDEDIAIVKVFFESSAVFLFETNSSQTWVDFFGTVGGLLGLCIGVSIVTIVEIFWLCMRIGVKALKVSKTNRRA